MMKTQKSSSFLWAVLFGVMIPLIGYALYSGLTIGKIGLPGGFSIEFRDPPAPARAEESLDGLADDELKARQAELESRLKEMEAQLNETREPASKPASTRDVSGAWQSPQGLSYQIDQRGRNITIQEINPFYGITAIGQGEMRDGVLTIDYRTAANTSGRAHLTLSENGQQLTGTFTDSFSGFQTEAQLRKISR